MSNGPSLPEDAPGPEVLWTWVRVCWNNAYKLWEYRVPKLEEEATKIRQEYDDFVTDQHRTNNAVTGQFEEVQQRTTDMEERVRVLENNENRRQGKQTATIAVVVVVVGLIQTVVAALLIRAFVHP